jgi:hypothetical protein
MAKCDLTLVFDRADRRYRGGERITGRVVARVDADCRCNALTISRFWSTGGKGNRRTGGHATKNLFSGEWRRGQTYEYPFDFLAPLEPLTYHGRILSVDWRLVANADLPWASDPKASQIVTLRPGSLPGMGRARPVDLLARSFELDRRTTGCLAGFLAFIAFLLLFALPVGPLFSAALFYIVFRLSRRHLAEWKLGQVSVQIPGGEAWPGGKVPFQIGFTPRMNANVRSISAVLRAIEQVTRGSGKNRRTFKETLYQQRTVVVGQRTVGPRSGLVADGSFDLPNLPAYSFRTRDNEVRWSITVKIDIPKWPDWEKTQVFRLGPAPSARPQPAAREEPTRLDADLPELPPKLLEPPKPPPSPRPTPTRPAESARPPRTGPARVLSLDGRGASPEPTLLEREARQSRAPSATQSQAEHRQPSPLGESFAAISTALSTEIEPARFDAAPAGGGSSPPPLPPDATARDLEAQIEALRAAPSYSAERGEIVDAMQRGTFDLSLTVDRIERSLLVDAEHLRDGRTAVGRLRGSDTNATLLFPASRNAEVDDLRPGDEIRVEGKMLEWNDLFERIEMEAVG